MYLLPDKKRSRKVLVEGLPRNIPDLEEPWHICLLIKTTKIPIGKTIYVSIFFPGFMLYMDFSFFGVESISRFTSTFVAICSTNSYPFGFTFRSKCPPLEILKLFVTTLSNQDNKVSFIWFYEDGELARSSGYMKTCHNTNILVQITGGGVSSLDGKSEIPNKKLANITRYILLKSNHNKDLWCFAY